MYLIVFRPYSDRNLNVICVYNEFVILGICVSMAAINMCPNVTQTQIDSVGWVFIVGLLLSLAAVWASMGPTAGRELWQTCTSFCRKDKAPDKPPGTGAEELKANPQKAEKAVAEVRQPLVFAQSPKNNVTAAPIGSSKVVRIYKALRKGSNV